MPPTISVTVGMPDCASAFEPVVPELLEPDELLQAARAAAVATAAAIAIRGLLGMGCSSGGGGFGGGRGPPGQQAAFQQADQALGGQRQDRDDQHRGEHAVRVEVVLRGGDHQPEAPLGAEELADDRADDREPERDVQAGDDPGQRRWDYDVAGDGAARGTQDPGVVEQVAVHLTDALEGVEEHHEEHQDRGQRHLGGDAQAEGDGEERAEHDPRDGIGDLDIRADDLGKETELAEQHADDHPGYHAEDEAEHGFLEGGPDLQPDGTVGGAVPDPVVQLGDDPAGLAPEEPVDDLDVGQQLPAADHGDQGGEAGNPDEDLPVHDGPPWTVRAYAASTSSRSDAQIWWCSS